MLRVGNRGLRSIEHLHRRRREASFELMGISKNGSSHASTAKNAGDRAQPRPRRVSTKPETMAPDVVGDRMLIRVLEIHPHTTNRASRPARKTLIRARGRYLMHDRRATQIGIDASRQCEQLLCCFSFPNVVIPLVEPLPGRQLTVSR